jgi:hypothetical protein
VRPSPLELKAVGEGYEDDVDEVDKDEEDEDGDY